MPLLENLCKRFDDLCVCVCVCVCKKPDYLRALGTPLESAPECSLTLHGGSSLSGLSGRALVHLFGKPDYTLRLCKCANVVAVNQQAVSQTVQSDSVAMHSKRESSFRKTHRRITLIICRFQFLHSAFVSALAGLFILTLLNFEWQLLLFHHWPPPTSFRLCLSPPIRKYGPSSAQNQTVRHLLHAFKPAGLKILSALEFTFWCLQADKNFKPSTNQRPRRSFISNCTQNEPEFGVLVNLHKYISILKSLITCSLQEKISVLQIGT